MIAVTSAQGAGKTTMLNEMAARGYRVVDRKASRSILADWDVTLDQVNSDKDLTIRFQEEILRRKIEDDSNTGFNEVVFTERSFVDLFGYALITLGKHNEYSSWLDDYYTRCCDAQKIYSRVVYLTSGHFDVEHDGVRGSNKHYAQMVDATFLHYYKEMTASRQQMVIDTPLLSARVAALVDVCDQILHVYPSETSGDVVEFQQAA